MRAKFGILWTTVIFGALQLSHYSCADEPQNQNKNTATTVIPSASPATKAEKVTTTVTGRNISQSASANIASSLIKQAPTDSATKTVNPTASTDNKQQTTTSIVTTALSASTGPPIALPTSTSPSVTSSVTALETKTTRSTSSLTPSQGTTQNTPRVTPSQGTNGTETLKQSSVASVARDKTKDAHTPTTEISTPSPTAGNTSPTQPQNIITSPAQSQNIATSSTQPQSITTATTQPQSITTATTQPQSITTATTQPQSITTATTQPPSITTATTQPQSITTATTQPQSITTATTQPPTTGTSSAQPDIVGQPARESYFEQSSAIPAGLTESPAETKSFNRRIKWTDAQNQQDESDLLLKVCWKLLKDMNPDTSCIIEGNEKNNHYTFTSAYVAADLSRVQQIYSDIKKSNDKWHMPKVLPAILASCGGLVFMLLGFVLCCTCRRRRYRKNQQQLTEEMQTVENGYHDNPTLEVMEFQPEMQEKKPPLNGEFNDSWIVPIDNLPKDDFSEEEDTHL